MLHRNPREDASWPENVENMQVFLSAGFCMVILSMFMQQKYFFFASNLSSSGFRHIGSLSTKQKFACDVMYMDAVHICKALFVASWTWSKWQCPWSGFHDFQMSSKIFFFFFNKVDHNSTEKLMSKIFLFFLFLS